MYGFLEIISTLQTQSLFYSKNNLIITVIDYHFSTSSYWKPMETSLLSQLLASDHINVPTLSITPLTTHTSTPWVIKSFMGKWQEEVTLKEKKKSVNSLCIKCVFRRVNNHTAQCTSGLWSHFTLISVLLIHALLLGKLLKRFYNKHYAHVFV